MYQQITIVGNLGSDPEMRYTASGVPVTSFSVAVNKRWTGQDGQRQEKTTWFRVTAWRQLGELASQYLTKGRQVMVVGEINDPDVWTDREGNHRASLEITARDIRFLSGGDTMGSSGGGAPSAPSGGGDDAPASDEDIPF
ncbi:MAG: single-stranded DNA-binding protein [Caldilineaceae bacterium]|nr:single-stranded DNA-binding protein [Caldilineaceae bacterium]MCB9138091.1 single-stranded DNA-binding protein [Caldilineaceae bacterium]